MGSCCATTTNNKSTQKANGLKPKRQDVKDKEEFVIEKADFIGLNKSKFKDCYVLGKTLGNGALGEVKQCKSKSVN